MMTSRICFALIAVAGIAGPLSAHEPSSRVTLVTLGAPATPDQLYSGKKFDFSPSELKAEHMMIDGRFNFVPERDKHLTVQQAK